jgi:ABC-2 type transport system permease protein
MFNKKNVLHYLQVYQRFATTSFSVNMSFRTSFALLIVMDLFFYFSSLAAVSIIFNHVEMIGPWNESQLLFYLSFMLMIDNLHMGLISESFWALSFDIRTGNFDFTLLKPVSSIFAVFFRYVRPSSMTTMPLAIGVLIYYGIQVGLTWLDWTLLPFMVILGLALLVVIEFVISTSMFWVTEGWGINFLRMQLQSLARWPNFIYSGVMRKALTIALPVLLIGSAPVHFLLDGSRWPLLLGMIIAIVITSFILSIIWGIGLRRYDSASS